MLFDATTVNTVASFPTFTVRFDPSKLYEIPSRPEMLTSSPEMMKDIVLPTVAVYPFTALTATGAVVFSAGISTGAAGTTSCGWTFSGTTTSTFSGSSTISTSTMSSIVASPEAGVSSSDVVVTSVAFSSVEVSVVGSSGLTSGTVVLRSEERRVGKEC